MNIQTERTKRTIWKALVVAFCFMVLIAVVVLSSMEYKEVCLQKPTSINIQEVARAASVQPIFYSPILRVSFASELKKEESPNKESVEKLIEEYYNKREKEKNELANANKYNYHNHEMKISDYKPLAGEYVMLHSFLPENTRLPERILVVFKTKDVQIDETEDEYKEDVKTFSNKANVSIETAKDIISSLRGSGYSITKKDSKTEDTVEVLWFDDGWDDKRPVRLDWMVEAKEGSSNLIREYDERGFLVINKVSKNTSVNITFTYQKMKDQYIPKPDDFINLQKELRQKEEELRELEKKNQKQIKRDISQITLMDVIQGRVKIEKMIMMSGGSGIFLGNYKFKDEDETINVRTIYAYEENEKALFLTNAHVAEGVLSGGNYVSEDKEVMYLVFPAISYIRYTSESDILGCPSQLLFINREPVMSWDYDCALLASNKIEGYQENRAILGDSDNVNIGDKVVSVGNPLLLQKFTTQGVISNKDYSILDWARIGALFPYLNQKQYNWLKNSNFWVDNTIGVGGTSGSGIWALEGEEKGKVIALRNMGMGRPNSLTFISKDGEVKDIEKKIGYQSNIKFTDISNIQEVLFESERIADSFTQNYVFFEDKELMQLIQKRGMIDIAGMNGGIPINGIKTFLQERGIDVSRLTWEPVNNKYWSK